jgi:hypothetical protein
MVHHHLRRQHLDYLMRCYTHQRRHRQRDNMIHQVQEFPIHHLFVMVVDYLYHLEQLLDF